MQRRQFLKTGSTVIGLLPFLQGNTLGTRHNTVCMNTEVVSLKVGAFSCTIFRDLQFQYKVKDYFVNAAHEELNQALKPYNVAAGTISSPFIAMLIEYANRKILIDTGIGFSEKPIEFRGTSHEIKGRLHALLRQEYVHKEDITDVIITHFHPDHIGGIYSEQGQLNFPAARFHMHEEEWQYWHSSLSDSQPGLFKFFIEKNITRLKDKNLHLIKGDFTELLPGITAIKAEGHTPGQITLAIQSEGERLLYVSDAFLHPLHIKRLDWQTNYDLDHEKAKLSRTKLLDLAYRETMLVNAFHFDFPGLGHIEKHQGNWDWRYRELKS